MSDLFKVVTEPGGVTVYRGKHGAGVSEEDAKQDAARRNRRADELKTSTRYVVVPV